MAYHQVHVEGAGKPLIGASVTVYMEDPTVPEGGETFVDGDKASIFSDYKMLVAESNPSVTDNRGDFKFHVATGTVMAIKISKTTHGARWLRFQEAVTSDLL